MKKQVFFLGITEFNRFYCHSSTHRKGVNRLGAYGRGHGMSSKRKVDLGIQQPLRPANASFFHWDRMAIGRSQRWFLLFFTLSLLQGNRKFSPSRAQFRESTQ